MYLDLEDYRPDTPRLESANSWRGGVLSLGVHIVVLLLILFAPAALFDASQVQPEPDQMRDQVRFVQMAPLKDRIAPPKPQAEQSDKDRRATTPERAPMPENPMPFSRGSTPEKLQGAPTEKAAGPDSPQPAPAPSPTPAPQMAAKVIPDATVLPASRPGGSLGQSLRNLQHYLQDQNFNNQKGGLAPQDPDIQFDSKGVEFGPWLARFIAQVKGNWFIPEAASVMSGHVVLQFNVHRDGTITDLRIAQPSTITSFTNAAFQAIKLSNPTMPLPDAYPTEQASFVVTFRYNEIR
ncbi:MAG TPA: TonB family protein [Vicinamibacterales bacterium]|nr:TonB family protein [Vicinamibacterales bacterium]